jgi:HK97 family phage major capsid protein
MDIGQFLSRLTTASLGSREIDLLRAGGGEIAEPHRCTIGWSSLTRDLTAAGAPYLQETAVGAAEAALRPYSAVVASGPQIIQTRPGVLVPKVSTGISAEWLTDEADTLDEVQPTMTPVSLTSRWVGALIQVSRLLLLQGREVSDVVAGELLGAVAARMDYGFLQGTGASGQPTGLANITGIGTASGGTVAYAAVATQIETVLAAGGREASLGFICTPAVASVLKQRARISGGRAIMDDGMIDNIPVRVTANAPSAVLLLADWSRVALAMFGDGIRVESDPYSGGFASGIVQMRVLTACDIAPMYASMIYTLTSVS